ncbi:unannotated protein [freshwater metagenome]|uniref:Unannotated protein n=1 Tax=freshwater metagenome TaxID=449393 RepID=A0A6J6T976_9ZZZZ
MQQNEERVVLDVGAIGVHGVQFAGDVHAKGAGPVVIPGLGAELVAIWCDPGEVLGTALVHRPAIEEVPLPKGPMITPEA